MQGDNQHRSDLISVYESVVYGPYRALVPARDSGGIFREGRPTADKSPQDGGLLVAGGAAKVALGPAEVAVFDASERLDPFDLRQFAAQFTNEPSSRFQDAKVCTHKFLDGQ